MNKPVETLQVGAVLSYNYESNSLSAGNIKVLLSLDKQYSEVYDDHDFTQYVCTPEVLEKLRKPRTLDACVMCNGQIMQGDDPMYLDPEEYDMDDYDVIYKIETEHYIEVE